ncbi:MAG: uroporphyrinogen-III synthase [Clostridia bacterium]
MTAPKDKQPLAGRGIVVTRPRETAPGLAARIEGAGGRPILYPALEIDPPTDPREAERVVDALESFDLAVFVSPTAAQKALALIARRARAWPPRLRAAAVGGASRAELERLGVAGALAPDTGADSEALLALPALLDCSGKRVVIFRGEGGRELLGDTLKQRGASVTYAACYRRSPPREDPAPLLDAWAAGRVHALTSSSSAGLAYLAQTLEERSAADRLRDTPVFVSHERIAAAARRLGAREVTACGPGDAEMLDALVAYFRAS